MAPSDGASKVRVGRKAKESAVIEMYEPERVDEIVRRPFAVVSDSGAVMTADSVSDIVDELLPEHGALGADAQFELRLRSLAETAKIAQAVALATRAVDQPSIFDELGEPGLTALTLDKAGRILDIPEWPFDVPLFVLATQYAPFTDVPAPLGNQVVVLDPSSERTFLEALDAVGEVEFMVNETALESVEDGDEAS